MVLKTWLGSSIEVHFVQKVNAYSFLLNQILANVHRGFQQQYASIRDELRKTVSEYIDELDPPEILITGHSLGGALADICAIDFALNEIKNSKNFDFSKKLKVINFGAPKVGDKNLEKMFNRNINGLRLINGTDYVPQMPKLIPTFIHGFRHCGKQIILKDTEKAGLFLTKYVSVKAHYMTRYLNSVQETKKFIKQKRRTRTNFVNIRVL